MLSTQFAYKPLICKTIKKNSVKQMRVKVAANLLYLPLAAGRASAASDMWRSFMCFFNKYCAKKLSNNGNVNDLFIKCFPNCQSRMALTFYGNTSIRTYPPPPIPDDVILNVSSTSICTGIVCHMHCIRIAVC